MTEDYFMQLYQEAERRLEATVEAQPKPTPTPEKEDTQNVPKT